MKWGIVFASNRVSRARSRDCDGASCRGSKGGSYVTGTTLMVDGGFNYLR